MFEQKFKMKKFLIILIVVIQTKTFGQTYTVVDSSKQPEYIGGNEAYQTFLQQNLQLPDSVKSGFFEGTIFMILTVSEDGSVSKTEIQPSEKSSIKYCSQCKKEALRISKLIPKFKPGTINGKTTQMNIGIPIPFKKP